MKFFLEEYEEHIQDHYCRSAVCKGLFQYVILPERCNGCTLCVRVCSSNAIQGTLKEVHTLDVDLCTQCHSCVEVCAKQAIVGVPVPADQQQLQMSEALQ